MNRMLLRIFFFIVGAGFVAGQALLAFAVRPELPSTLEADKSGIKVEESLKQGEEDKLFAFCPPEHFAAPVPAYGHTGSSKLPAGVRLAPYTPPDQA